MKLICWNMGAGYQFDRGRHGDAWAWLNEQDADVALLQEVVLPEHPHEKWGSVLHARKYSNPGAAWGSAVLTNRPGYRLHSSTSEHPWLNEFAGSACVAQPPEDGGLPWLVSLHANATPLTSTYLEERDLDGVARCSPRSVWEIDVLTHDLGRLLAGRPFLAGGDLNGSLLFDASNGWRENEDMF